MIKGNTQKEYFDKKIDSSSSLKTFSQDRRKYEKVFIRGEKVEDDELQSNAAITGSLVDCLIFEKDQFDNRYFLSSVAKAPTGNMELFCNSLLKYSDELDVSTFEEIARKAYKDSGYKWTFEKVLEKFSGSDAEIFFKEALEIRKKGLTVVTLDQVQNSEKIVQELKTNEFTKSIINLVNSDRYTIYPQLQIEDFDLDGLPMKAMLDLVIVDHTLKTITPYDLKITWSVEGFIDEYLLYRRGYFQYYTYYWGLKDWKNKVGLDDYTVNYLTFLVGDSINYYSPILYKVTGNDMGKAYSGFEKNGRYYPGIEDTIKDLKWAKENNIWRISRNNYLSDGIVNLNL